MATARPTANCKDEPPSYAATFPERDPSRTDVIKIACRALDHRAHSSFGNADARSIHRLRNWLCYMLTVDYKVATASAPITLSATDAAHFDDLSATVEAYSNTINTSTQPHTNKSAAAEAAKNDEHAAALEDLFWHQIHLPCLALNLPTATVALYLRRFAVNKTASLNRYAGCCRAVLQTHGVRGWAAKLLTDRSVIVPRVASNRAVEQGLLQAIKRLEEAWFVRLDGFDCEVAEHLELRVKGRDDDDDGGWRHAAVGAFELTQMGRRWEARLGELREVGGLGQQQHSSGGASLWERTKLRFRMFGRMGSSRWDNSSRPSLRRTWTQQETKTVRVAQFRTMELVVISEQWRNSKFHWREMSRKLPVRNFVPSVTATPAPYRFLNARRP